MRISDWSSDVGSSDLQVNENWLLTPEILSKFATHYRTGDPLPQALVDKILASQKFNQGFETVEYLASAILDMKLHNRTTPVPGIADFDIDTLAEIVMPKQSVMRHSLPQLGPPFCTDPYFTGLYS